MSATPDQLIDLVRARQRIPGPQATTVQSRDAVGITQHLVDVRVSARAQPARDETGPEGIPRAGRVLDVHVERGGADLLAIDQREAALRSERRAGVRRLEPARHLTQ